MTHCLVPLNSQQCAATCRAHANNYDTANTPRNYNGTGEDSKVAVGRALKAHNPNVKVYFYQPADRLGDTVYVQNALAAHPGEHDCSAALSRSSSAEVRVRTLDMHDRSEHVRACNS